MRAPAASATRRSASGIACEPPFANGQPAEWPTPPNATPNALVSGWPSGSVACVTLPAKSACAAPERKTVRASSVAGHAPRRPKRASSSGSSGMRSSGERIA